MRHAGRHALAMAALATLLPAALLLASAPPALAQVEEEPPLALTIEAFPHRGRPLVDALVTTLVVDADCALAGPVTRSVHVVFSEVEGPSWATAVVSPAELTAQAGVEECVDGRVRVEAQLLAALGEDAPALAPARLRVRVEATDPLGRVATAEAEVPVEASYFGILDVSAPTTIRRVPPGAEVRFPLQVQNFGNGETRVSFERVDAPGALPAQVPADVVLESRQQGGDDTTATVDVVVRAPESRGPGTVTIRIAHASTQDPDAPPGRDLITFLVEAGAAGTHDEPGAREVPLPALWPPVAGLLAALARRAAPGRRHV